MSLLRPSFIKALGIRVAYASEQEQHHPTEYSNEDRERARKDMRYSGLPMIPSDIAYRSGKETSGSKPTGILHSIMEHNPAVIIGMGLTTLALLGMIRKSVLGDKMGTQRFMQYRIVAQFGTVLALVAGVVFLGGAAPTKSNGQAE